ncbi:hypothetical protein [Clostridium perfringens]|uniref:hypothetical protein n=1 Tax=Clostridium perfringens TaxID=1502 RepID=UPI000992C087|nr:hypothetical protein [Clostridium perfringens]AQW23478.1 hypothetical protein BXT91_06010 [Clostridium perfringens]ATD48940.1 hypothetical protein CMR01_09155 [Clostridium perfringens]
MDKTLFKKTEWQLYNYFEKDLKIKAAESKRDLLKKNIEELERKIKTTDVSLSPDVKSIGFSERVQTSNDGVSAAEKNMINLIERLEREIEKKEEQIVDLELFIMESREENKILDDYVGWLGENHRKFLEYKYKNKLRNWEIANNLNISEVTCTRMKNDLIKDVARWQENLLFIKEVN